MIGWGAIGCLGFPGSSAGKESTSNTGDRNLIPGLGRSFWRRDRLSTPVLLGFPGGSDGKESPCNAGDPGSIPGSGSSLGEGIGYPLQYSWASFMAQLVKNPPAVWETWVGKIPWRRERLPTPVNSMDSIVHGVAKSWT